jgi:CheY-like chemotaxis protein
MIKNVLMLEDDNDDRLLIQEVMQGLDLPISISFTRSSEGLLNRLKDHSLPDLILLDYNAVPEDGLAVLKRIKQEPAWAHIPVVILSDNNQQPYRDACYQSGASSFIQKPLDMTSTQRKIETFFRYWLDVVEL